MNSTTIDLNTSTFSPKDVFPFLIVSLFWGITNPLIELSSTKHEKNFKPFDFTLGSLWQIVKHIDFILAFGINQIGSILYAYLLGLYPSYFSSICANSLTTLVTFVT